jgi:hypothetical protein
MKRLFLVSSYCDTEEKVEVLKKNLIKIKELGWDSMLLSPISLDTNVIELCDYYYQTKENPVSTIEEKTYIHWRSVNKNGEMVRMERFFPEYGWAALYQNKKLSQIGLTFDYDIFYHVIYDTKFTDELIKEIESNTKNKYYSNISTNGDFNEFSLHYLPLDRDMMISFESFLNKDKYNNSDDLTHDYMLRWCREEGLEHSDIIVEEYINYYTDINFFSIYDGEDVNVFFEKYEKNNKKNRLFIYDLKHEKVDVIINNSFEFNNIKEKDMVDTGFYTKDIYSIKVSIMGQITECIDSYNKIERTKIKD